MGQRPDRHRRCRAGSAPDPPRPAAESETRSFDVAGAVSVTAGLALLVYALVEAPDAGWGSAQTIGLLAAAVALLGAFVVIERRSPAPLVPFSIFRLRTLTGANVVGILTGASLFSMFFFISLYMQNVLGYSAIKAGLSLSAAGGLDHPLGRDRLRSWSPRSASSRCWQPACR